MNSRALLLLLLPLLGACSNPAPFVTTIGILKPGHTMTVRVGNAPINAFSPAAAEPRNRFTVAATALRGTTPAVPSIRPAYGGIVVLAPAKLASLLLRVPDGVTLAIESRQGDVNVTDVSGPVQVALAQGDVRIFLQKSYAQARVGQGNISIAMGATQWPGTLRISTQRGDVEVSLGDAAAFTVHLHTGDGTLFTDFNLLGSSQGASETIDGAVNRGGGQRIEIQTGKGSIRLLRLHAQP
ncbi:MAG: DUF4097 family beta strand repeat protein [Candidatus Eremiobacteraeota bacterium]|nr:DUF4097 family beta strand repeat protein [Candidatus Eremiobacteraeota bacterium]